MYGLFTYIYHKFELTYIYHKFRRNLGKYTSPIEHLGYPNAGGCGCSLAMNCCLHPLSVHTHRLHAWYIAYIWLIFMDFM